MAPTDAELRKYFMRHYDNDELEEFCFDYFSDVRENFAPRMSKSDRVMQLVSYCRRHKLTSALLEAIKDSRPDQFQQIFGNMDQADEAESPMSPKPPVSAPLASAIKVVESNIETIQIRIMVRSTGERHIVEIPYDGLVDEMIPLLVEQLGLPVYFIDGSSVPRELFSETRKIRLRGEDTFRQNGVKDGEILSFYYSGGDE